MALKSPASRPVSGTLTAGFALLVAACAPGGQPPDSTGKVSQPLVAAGSPASAWAELRGAVPSAVDERGVPAFLSSTSREAPPRGTAPEAAALFHVERHQAALGLRPEAMTTLEPIASRALHGGGSLSRIKQRVGGVEVYRRELRVLLDEEGALVAMSGRLHPSVPQVSAFARPPEASLSTALSHLFGMNVPMGAVRTAAPPTANDSDEVRLEIDPAAAGLVMPEPAQVVKVLYPQGEALRPAWRVSLYAGRPDSTGSEAWMYLVAADDGSVLERVNLTQNDVFSYRAWADPTGDLRPMDTALADFTPHPTGKLDYAYPAPAPANLIMMEGFNKNPMGGHDPWLAAGAKDTQGNNADAYCDKFGADGFTAGKDYRASTTAAGVFDRPYDFKAAPDSSRDQVMVGTMQAFYDVNWMHDYFYDSGFDEKAGNGQKDNFGRGGKGNDAMRVETQDASGRDNANMSTPPDGATPRMQMFLWTGKEQRVLHITPGDLEPISNSASFGPDKFDFTGEIVEVNDGAFTTTDGCEELRNGESDKFGPSLEGKIALIDRGTCTFKLKSVHAQDKGAKGVIIVNNQTGGAPGMGNGAPMSTVLNIPVLSTTISGGAKIRELMQAGPVMARLARVRDIDRDAGLDATVVTHEWGHYLHHRLADCNQNQCGGMSEGWADFNALMMVAHEGDDLDGVYPLAIYASVAFPFPGYFGIRRYPYSTNMEKNPLTFKQIADGVALPPLIAQSGGGPNSEVHNTGEVWASMMWEVYVALQKDGRTRSPALTFEEVHRKMADYVVAGHQMTPPDATLSETRDALLAVARTRDMRDFNVIAQAFAKRGLGTCADSPPRDSQDNKGTVEAFTVQPRLVISASSLDDVAAACSDKDGVLDAGEQGTIRLTLVNGAPTDLSGAKVTLSSNLPDVTFVGPSTFDIPSLAPLAKYDISTVVTVDPKMASAATFKLKVDGSTATNCGGTVPELSWKINYDVKPMISRADDVETEPGVWTPDGDRATSIWSRAAIDPTNHAWHGRDSQQYTDTSLVSPELKVSSSTWFAINFRHRYSFEFDTSVQPTGYYDGGVIEISDDGGMTWKDAIEWKASPPYNGFLPSGDIALENRQAFVGQSASWPRLDSVRINFADIFAGKTIKVRFRIGTDQKNINGTFFGWDIDDISFEGIDNTPFTATTYDSGMCGVGPRGVPLEGELSGSGCRVQGRGAASSLAPLGLLALAGLGLGIRRRRRARIAA